MVLSNAFVKNKYDSAENYETLLKQKEFFNEFINERMNKIKI